MLEAKTALALMVALALSGCASVPGTDPTEPLETQGTDLGRLNVLLTLDPAEVDAGKVLNLSLEAVAGTPDMELDLQNATWTIEVVAIGDATGADDGASSDSIEGGGQGCDGDDGSSNCQNDDDGNSTQGGNATRDDNATQEPTNGTAPPGDVLPGPVAALNGTGLPFVGNLTVDGNGSFQVVATVSAAGFETATVSESLTILTAAVEPDLCTAFTGPQEPFSASGTVLLPDDVGVHEFELGPCHTRMVGSLSAVGGDLDLFLYDPAGNLVDSSENYSVEGVSGEEDLVAEDTKGLPVGTWTLEVLNYASVATDYDVQVTFE